MTEITFTRRNWLKRLGTFSALIPSLSSTDEEKKEVPELRDQDGVVRYMEVPKEWLEHKRTVKSVRDRMENEYLGREGIDTIGIERAPETYGGKNGFQIRIARNKEKIKQEIPRNVNDVPVNVIDQSKHIELCYNHKYSELPPGVQIRREDKLETSIGTTGFVVSDNGTNYLTTAEHVVNSGDVWGDGNFPNYQDVGDVHKTDDDLDITLIDSPRQIPTTIQGEGSTYPIGGWVTKSGVASRVSNHWDGYRKIGSTTGETTGGLTAYELSGSNSSWNGEGVEGGAKSAQGDSGAPAFDVGEGEAYLIYSLSEASDPTGGSNNCRNLSEFGKSLGAAAYEINNHYYIKS